MKTTIRKGTIWITSEELALPTEYIKKGQRLMALSDDKWDKNLGTNTFVMFDLMLLKAVKVRIPERMLQFLKKE